MGDAVQRSFGEAVRQQNLRIAGYPRFEVEAARRGRGGVPVQRHVRGLSRGRRWAISRRRRSAGRSCRWATRKSTRRIEIMRKQRVHFQPAERPAQDGDRVTIDYRGTLDGAEFQGSTAQGQAVVLGEGRLLKDFETQLAGMKRRRNEDLRPALSRRLPGQGSRRQDGAVRSVRQGSGRAAPARRGRRIREEPGRGGRRSREDARGGEGQPGARGQGRA